jgi:hypothetical protein
MHRKYSILPSTASKSVSYFDQYCLLYSAHCFSVLLLQLPIKFTLKQTESYFNVISPCLQSNYSPEHVYGTVLDRENSEDLVIEKLTSLKNKWKIGKPQSKNILRK